MDMAWNFVIGGDGRVYETRGWDRLRRGDANYGDRSVAIALMGGFQNRGPSPLMLDAARRLIACGVKRVSQTIR